MFKRMFKQGADERTFERRFKPYNFEHRFKRTRPAFKLKTRQRAGREVGVMMHLRGIGGIARTVVLHIGYRHGAGGGAGLGGHPWAAAGRGRPSTHAGQIASWEM